MQLSNIFSTVGRSDVKLIGRDQFLMALLVYPILFWAAMRWGMPALANWLQNSYDWDLTQYYVLAVSYLVGAIPMFIGLIGGMMLVEEQDDKTLTAIMVTPVSLDQFVLYRCIMIGTISFGLLMLILPTIAIASVPTSAELYLSLIGALNGPLNALLFFALSQNKVQAFGMLKVLSTLNVLPVVAWFAMPWDWLFGFFPMYWGVKGYWLAAEGAPYWWVALPAAVLYSVAIWYLIGRFRAKAYSGAIS